MQRFKGKHITRFASVLLATVFVVHLTSCRTARNTHRLYEGPQLDRDEIAKLVCWGKTIRINSVNGKKSPKGEDTFGNVKLEILPGDYDLVVSFSGRSKTTVRKSRYHYHIFFRYDSTENVDIAIKAEAGHIYLIDADHTYQENRWYVVIKDQTDGRFILREGPFPLNRIRTGDNQAARHRTRE